jgi:hypothetical protein
MTGQLKGTVGLGGANQRTDVIAVQTLLKGSGVDPGKIDGRCGPRTVAAIQVFQRRFLSHVDGRVDPNGLTWKKLLESTKKELIKGALASDFHLQGDRLAVLGRAIDIVGYTDNALTIAELAGLIAEGCFMSGVAAGTSIASAVLFPVGVAIALVNAMEAGQRLAGMVAVACTETAWAFNDPMPVLSREMQSRIREAGRAKEIPAYEKAWKDASDATLKGLAETVAKRPGVSKRAFQVLLRAAGDDSRQTLCRVLLGAFEKDVTDMEKKILRTYQYPN